MLILIFFILFLLDDETNETEKKTISGETYTAEWWRIKAEDTKKGTTVSHLNVLYMHNIVRKEKRGEYDIVRFIPYDNFSVNDITNKLKEMSLRQSLQEG